MWANVFGVLIAAKPTADFDAQVPQSQQTADRFVTWMYTEVKAGHAGG